MQIIASTFLPLKHFTFSIIETVDFYLFFLLQALRKSVKALV